MELLKLENVCFSYGKTQVLDRISYTFENGKIYSIIGRSGAGKTTLLSLLSGLSLPSSGSIYYQERNLKKINPYQFRSRYVGVVFQNFNLLTRFTALENVLLSMDISGKKYPNKKRRAYELLEEVGLSRSEADRRVLKLSGGQQQRVAIARALSYEPDLILADEPTGNLDQETQNEILGILKKLAQQGKCVILVTHSPEVAQQSDEVYTLQNMCS
ncbi:MAG: ABC transporter ATP-binding protein [Lachnospiraceae bacterium]|nr:ABC transporter ATP-binding protein [Lachnospiraceae bacterium]